jgi:hypothetical protein
VDPLDNVIKSFRALQLTQQAAFSAAVFSTDWTRVTDHITKAMVKSAVCITDAIEAVTGSSSPAF